MPILDPFVQYAGPLQPGDRGPRVLELQRDLRDAGTKLGLFRYGRVEITSEYDAKTQAEVRSFQADWGLRPTGIADRDVQQALFLARTPLGRFHDLGLTKDAQIMHIISTIGFVPDLGATPRPASSFTMSRDARLWTFFDETGNNFKLTAYMIYPGDPKAPGNNSGVTLGPGYDLGFRPNIAATLIGIGVDPAIANKLEKEAGGLTKQPAYDYVQKNGVHGTKLICLTDQQQIALQDAYLPDYEKLVKKHVSVPIIQREFDALVSFATNPGGSIVPVMNSLNRKEVCAAMQGILQRLPKNKSIRKGLMNRRRREVEWFITGRYTL